MSDYVYIIFLVSFGNIRFFVSALDREDAKRVAHRWIGGDSDQYTVTPLTERGDRIRFELQFAI